MKISQIVIRTVAILIIAAPLSLSCQDHQDVPPANLPCPDAIIPKTPEQILIGNAWKIEDLRFVQNNVLRYYKRGIGYNSDNYDGEYTEFFSDNTGMNHGWDLSKIPLTWSFANPEKTAIRFTLKYPTPITVLWENMIFSEKSIRYTETYTKEGTNYLVAGIRTPK